MYFFIMFPFPGYVFILCFLGGPRRPVGRPKNAIFSARKNVIFSDRKNDVFSRETIRCFLAPALSWRRRISFFPPTGLNLELAEISTQTCQFKTTNVKIHPAVPKVYTHLISFGQMEMANASENFGEHFGGVETLEWYNPRLPQECPKRFFGHLKNAVFFGPQLPDDGPKKSWLCGWLAIWLAGWLSSWLAIWLARWLRWLAGYLAIGFVAAWLAIWLLAIWLAGWLADWQIDLAIWLSLWMARSLACCLAI